MNTHTHSISATAPTQKVSFSSRFHVHSVTGLIGFVVVAFWLVMSVIGPMIAPYGPNDFVSNTVFAPMSTQYFFGTDYLGRDMFSRVLDGTSYTIGVALAATVAACLSGVISGLVAAAATSWVDMTISRTQDALISIPSKMFALIMVASFGSSVSILILTAAIAYMPGSFRIARSLAVNVMTLDYVQVARLRGESMPYIIFKEVLPNMFRPVLTDFGLRFVFIVLLLSAMSFLGLGIQPPEADWGSLVRENIGGLSRGAPAVITPAIAIATLTIGVNLLIDSVGSKSLRH